MRRTGSASHKALHEHALCPAPRKLLWAILVGVALGLIISLATVSRRSHRTTVAEASLVQETLVHKIAQQASPSDVALDQNWM